MNRDKTELNIKPSVDVSQYQVGVIIARFQVHKLHSAQIALLDKVCENHKKVILFLGVANVPNTSRNPLDFATRKVMVQDLYPNIVILPARDNRSNENWSQKLDEMIEIPFGNTKPLLYGSRDSFIPYYSGKYDTTELLTDVFYSGTEIRKEVSKEILSSADFRAGIIHSCAAQYPVAYPTADVVAYNDDNQILMGQKPNEKKWRFVGGHVDVTDTNYEHSARREFSEETGGCEIDGLTYVCSYKVPDWRYAKERSGIITSLFIGKFIYGRIKPSDDISALKWVDLSEVKVSELGDWIVEEHVYLMEQLIKAINEEKVMKELGFKIN